MDNVKGKNKLGLILLLTLDQLLVFISLLTLHFNP